MNKYQLSIHFLQWKQYNYSTVKDKETKDMSTI